MTGPRSTPPPPGAGPSSASRGYRVVPMSRARRALAVGQEAARRKHTMFGLVEADLTIPRRLLRDHRDATGERLSLTAYVVTCVAAALAEFPAVNAFRRGRSLVFLDEIIVEVLLERTIDGQPAVGYLPIRHADTKSLRAVHDEIRAGQASRPQTIAGQRWLDLVPSFLTRPLMEYMSHSPRWVLRLGVVGVNNLGMGASVAGWGLAPGAGTLGVSIGGITTRPGLVADALTRQEVAHLTLAFDHDVIDGAPAARFTARLVELLAAGESIRDLG
ncbi:2-oxo acid dehydrogenase subunit E2 [Raineyella sp. LH-20]|uniref:2-oxo acid dehydrogenase subunit E2 n=1 Tax=Raineyella sp. LH-20 TaxID=3081204 RepID=UPI00295337BE|nr:2-oxo acid dehydrogenase subunit E2 [Raineyella sp. LH-20]WOP19710.1 2-oxo acid dehydrogenase subunit E2 [Raineyella sp. LH-20]